MKRHLSFITIILTLTSTQSFGQDSINWKIEKIDKYVSVINSDLNKFQKEHQNCCDCFGSFIYYKDSATIVKIHNYQSCFNIDYYFENNELVFVAIDGSFERNCGGTEANYCWDKSITRDYKDKIYYNKQKKISEIESGSKPCCKIAPCGDYEKSIDFDKKADIFLTYILKVKNKIVFDSIVEYEIYDRQGEDIVKGIGNTIKVSKLKYNTLYHLRAGQSTYTKKNSFVFRPK